MKEDLAGDPTLSGFGHFPRSEATLLAARARATRLSCAA